MSIGSSDGPGNSRSAGSHTTARKGDCLIDLAWTSCLPLLLELVFQPDRNGEVDIRLRDLVPIVGAVARNDCVGSDAEDPVRRAVQVNMATNNARQGELVIVETHHRGRLSKQIILEVPVYSAHQRMGNQRAMLVVRPEPFRPSGEEVLTHKRALDVIRGVRRRGAGAQVAAAPNAPNNIKGPFV